MPRIGASQVRVVLFLTVLASLARADSEVTRFSLYERFQAGVNEAGWVSKLDTRLGYDFTPQLGVDAGLPLYFVRPSREGSALGAESSNGIGNVYAAVRFHSAWRALGFASVLTLTAPTGDKERGFSTGRVTADWTNHAYRQVGRWTPFGSIGIANTITDTAFFLRPFSSVGLVGHLEGGAEWRIASPVALGASAYKVLPSGEQRFFSRVFPRPSPNIPGRGAGAARSRRPLPFETAPETVASADLAEDHGASIWVNWRPRSFVNFEVGYSRSVRYAYDTLFFGAGFNVGSIVKSPRSDLRR